MIKDSARNKLSGNLRHITLLDIVAHRDYNQSRFLVRL